MLWLLRKCEVFFDHLPEAIRDTINAITFVLVVIFICWSIVWVIYYLPWPQELTQINFFK